MLHYLDWILSLSSAECDCFSSLIYTVILVVLYSCYSKKFSTAICLDNYFVNFTKFCICHTVCFMPSWSARCLLKLSLVYIVALPGVGVPPDTDYPRISVSESAFNPDTDIIFSHPSISVSVSVSES